MADEGPPEADLFCKVVASVDAVVTSQHVASTPILAAHAPGLVALLGPINITSRTCAWMLKTRNSIMIWLTPMIGMTMTPIILIHFGMNLECGWWNNPLRWEVMLQFSRPLLKFSWL